MWLRGTASNASPGSPFGITRASAPHARMMLRMCRLIVVIVAHAASRFQSMRSNP
jgi:hypothetical protein